MLTDTSGLAEALDKAIIGYLTAVNTKGQPQTSPIWFMRDGDDLVVYNRPRAARLRSIAQNPHVALNLRADWRGKAAVTIEGIAAVEEELPPAIDFSGYVDKYDEEIADLGWTPESFSDDYSVGLRITVTRVRSWGLDRLNTGELDQRV